MSAGAEFSAPILEALGHHDAAALLRYSGDREERDRIAELEDEVETLEASLEASHTMVSDLRVAAEGLLDAIKSGDATDPLVVEQVRRATRDLRAAIKAAS